MASPGDHDAVCSEVLAATCPTGPKDLNDGMAHIVMIDTETDFQDV